MSLFEIPPNIDHKDQKYVEHPIDVIRPAFMHHVIGPLAHTIAVNAADEMRDTFLSSLYGSRGRRIRRAIGSERTCGITHYSPDKDAHHGVRYLEGKRIYPPKEQLQLYPAWEILTPRQQRAATRFSVPANNTVITPDEAFFLTSNTIGDAIEIIYDRHPELALHDTATMVDFLRDPHNPSILRGFMPAGNRFMASLSRVWSHVEAMPWIMDPKKPVLTIPSDPDKPLLTTRELRNAAQAHRSANETMSPTELRKRVALISMRYSSGCPVRHLQFRTDNEELAEYGLNFSPEQIDNFNKGTRPVMHKIDEHQYAIKPDSVQVVVDLLADGLETLTPKRYKVKQAIRRIL